MSAATEEQNRKGSAAGMVFLSALAAWIISEPAVLVTYAEYPWLRLLSLVILMAAVMKLTTTGLRIAARRLEYHQANQSASLKGSAGFLSDLRLRRLSQKAGMFLGARRQGRREVGIIRDFSSNAAVIGPSGSGKGHTVLCTTMLTLPVTAGRVSVDLKFENFDILEPPLKEQGLKVALLDLGNLDTKGRGEFFNPLSIIADLFWEDGGLTIITEQAEELAHELYGEPAEGDDANSFFRDGTRMLIVVATLITLIIDGDDATLGTVSQLLNDRDKLRATLELVCGKLPIVEG